MSYIKGNPFANQARQMDPYALVEQVLFDKPMIHINLKINS